MFNDDEDNSISPAQVTEVYTSTFFLRNSQEIKNSLDFAQLDDLLWQLRQELTAKDVFSILETHSHGSFNKGTKKSTMSNELLKIHQAAIDWLLEHFGMLMPEEVVLALKLTQGNVFAKNAQTYLTSQLNQMEMQEATKIFFALTQKKGALPLKDSRGKPDLQTY